VAHDDDRKGGHGSQAAPALAPVESTAGAISVPRSGPRARTLGAADHRAHGRAVAARHWRECLDGSAEGVTGSASWMGADHTSISRYASQDKLLPHGDVLAAPPRLAARMLRLGLDHVEGQPCPGEQGLVAEAIRAASEAIEVAQLLEAAPPEAMQAALLDDLIDLVEGLATRLWRIGRRLRDARRRKGGERGLPHPSHDGVVYGGPLGRRRRR
jgi:hypothetical protein